MVNCRMVAGMVAVCEQGYWMHEVSCYHGPHIGHQFLSKVLLFQFPLSAETSLVHRAHGIEDTDVFGVVW